MSAPNGPSQVEVLQAVVQQAPTSSTRECSETHGTGTALGDPIEVGALRTVFEQSTHSKCMVLGALKSRLGHTEGAAGLMGVLKAAQMLGGHCMPSNLHLREINPKLDLEVFGAVFVES